MNWMNCNFFIELEKSLPPIFTRETASKMIGGIFTARTLSNFDAAGTGPRIKLHIGKKIAYERSDFIKWLERMVQNSTIKEFKIKKSVSHYYW